jgi:uncharacterized glyoxalase superfamily protein PhnB
MASPTMKKLTPVMFVREIEPCLEFWTRLGFERTAEVPEGDRIGFVLLTKDAIELMYQSRASVQRDLPALADMPSCTALYIEVDDLDGVQKHFVDAPVVIGRRNTFYGAEEFGVHEPGGNVIMFSQPSSSPT